MAKEKEKGVLETIWGDMETLYGVDETDGVLAPSIICSSGSHAIDDILGCWGLLGGRLIQYAGKESSGKTLMSLMAVKEWQKLSPKNWALWIDAEFAMDEEWARTMGVDVSPNRWKKWKTNDGAKIFARLCGVPHKDAAKDPKKLKTKAKPGLLDLIKERGGAEGSGLGLIVLDSIACIQPPLEQASVIGKSNMALQARFWPPVLRSITPMLAETGVTFIGINQVRTDPGKMFGDPTQTPGGAAWKHACSVMLHLIPVTGDGSKIMDGEEQIGHVVRGRVDKNRGGPPFRKCEFSIQYYKGLVDKHVELATLAVKYGVVDRPNNRTYVYKDDKWTSKEQFHTALLNPALTDIILEDVKKAKANGVRPAVIEEEAAGNGMWAEVNELIPEEEEEG
jgi:recombination protein RecA